MIMSLTVFLNSDFNSCFYKDLLRQKISL